MKRRLGPALAGLFGLGWFLYIQQGRMLNPTELDPLLFNDWSTHILGWLFYRNAPWGLPLGEIPNLLHPNGTTLGYTDSLPWLGVLLKPFNGLLPADFQFIGLWIASAFVLQGYWGARLVERVSDKPWQQALGGALFVTAPTLLLRQGHPSLCAHWPLLVALHWHLGPRTQAPPSKRTLWAVFALNAFFAGIHPYLEAMVGALSVALFLRWWRFDRRIGPVAFAGFTATLGGLIAGLFALFGYIGGAVDARSYGFGAFSANLATFFNPLQYSRWFPAQPQGPLQYEGFAYLGFGALLLGVATLVSVGLRLRAVRAWDWTRVLPYAAVALAFAVFAYATPMMWFSRKVVSLEGLYGAIPQLTGMFRSSGRFIWLLHALVVTGAVLVPLRVWRDVRGVGTALLLVALGVQLAEVNTEPVRQAWGESYLRRFPPQPWDDIARHYRHLVLYPPEVAGIPCAGVASYRHPVVVSLAYQAYRSQLTFNSGYVARFSQAVVDECNELHQAVRAGQLDPLTVYAVDARNVPYFVRAGATCGLGGHQFLCVRPTEPDPVVEYLRARATAP